MRINTQIRVPQVRLIDEDGAQLGIKTTQEALKYAMDAGKDLVEIAPLATPPVCRVISFSKLKYEQEKKARGSKKKQKGGHLKEIRLRPNIGEHDLMVKLKHAVEFLEGLDKVRFTIMFRGREGMHKDLGNVLAEKIKKYLIEKGDPEQRPFLLGNRLMLSFAPKKAVVPVKNNAGAQQSTQKQEPQK